MIRVVLRETKSIHGMFDPNFDQVSKVHKVAKSEELVYFPSTEIQSRYIKLPFWNFLRKHQKHKETFYIINSSTYKIL